MVKTNYMILRELEKLWREGFESGEIEFGYADEKHADILRNSIKDFNDELSLRNLRDFSVLFLSHVAETREDVEGIKYDSPIRDLCSAITAVIDTKLFNLGCEV